MIAKGLDEAPRLIHSLPGRVRVHLPGLSGHQPDIEALLRQVPGVHSARANPLTSTVLIRFNPAAMDERALFTVLGVPKSESKIVPDTAPSTPEPRGQHRENARARIAVRG